MSHSDDKLSPQELERNARLQQRYHEYLTQLNEGALQRVHFDFSQLYPETDDLEALLGQVDDLKRGLDSFRPLEPEQVANLEQYLNYQYTYESNRIEGNTLTFQETTLVLEKGLTIAGKSLREHLEVTGHAQAFDYVREIAQGETEFSERVLKTIHQLILGAIDRKNAGTWRGIDVAIAGSVYEPPPHYLLPQQMSAYFTYYREHRGQLHPALLAADLHEKLVAIHPFVDGNGRTARLVMNLILLRRGLPIANIAADRRGAYYDALEAAHLTGDLSNFRRFILAEIKRTLIWYLQRVSTIENPTKGRYFFDRLAPWLMSS